MTTQLVNQYGQPLSREPISLATRGVTRQTYDDYYLSPFSTGFSYISPDTDSDFKLQTVDERQLSSAKADKLIDIFVNSSSDLSRALSDTVSFCNTGWSLTCEDEVGQRVLDNAQASMATLGQNLNTKIDSMIAGGFLWGALYTESIFDVDGQTFLDLAVISPSQARFQRREDPVLGQHWQLGQEERGRFVAIEDPTIIYTNLTPRPDKPFGKPMVSAALFPIIFQLGLLKSLRQIIESQAWPRQVWKIDREILANANINPKQIDKIVKDTERDIEKYMNNANLDKAKQPILGSEVTNETIGGVNRSNFGAIESIQRILDSMITRGLKQYPILFGINSASGLSDNSNAQLEAHHIFISSFQVAIEDMITRQFQMVLDAAGFPQLKPIFKLDRNNSFVRQQRSTALEKEVGSIMSLINARVIDRPEGRQLLREFSTQFNTLAPDIPDTVDVNEVIQLVAAGMLTPQEGRDQIRMNNQEYADLSAELPQMEEPNEEEEEAEGDETPEETG